MVRTKRILIGFITLILVLSTVTGCASQKSMTATASSPAASETRANSGGEVFLQFSEEAVGKNEDAARNYAEADGQKTVEDAAQGIVGTGFSGVPTSGAGSSATLDILAQRKVIRNANLSIEVGDFYVAYGNLQAMINGIGYISESNIHRDFYTYEDERKARVTGNITLRIDARHFDNILTDIKGLGEVIDDRIYSSDVTDQYFDTEGRLKVLKIEYEYLEDYMRSLTKPDDIFKTRTRMTELQSEIERLTGTLNKWNDLVELSTIYISMTEKYPDEMLRKQSNTYWDRVGNALNRSITGIVDALGDLLIFIIQAIPVLIVLAIIAWIGYRIVKRIIGKKNTNSDSGPQHMVKTEPETKSEIGDTPETTEHNK